MNIRSSLFVVYPMMIFTVICFFGAKASEADQRSQTPLIRSAHSGSTNVVSGPIGRVSQGFEAAYGRIPLAFEANQGLRDPQVRFTAKGKGYALFITPREAVLSLRVPSAEKPTHGPPSLEKGDRSVVRIRLLGADVRRVWRGLQKLSGTSNYFVGKDPTRWKRDVPLFAAVKAEEVYPGVDMVYYGDQGHLEYDFTVHPGSDPNHIEMQYEGVDKARIDGGGDLVLELPGGKVTFKAPVVYQPSPGGNTPVEGRYVSRGKDKVGFELGPYDRTRDVVIDPVLIYSTFFGGIGWDNGRAIAADADGNAYVVGDTEAADLPTTSGAFQTARQTAPDGFVAKLDPTGTSLVYCTYLGGSSSDTPMGVRVDTNGNAYVTGTTTSTDFPTTSGAFQTTFGGFYDVFVCKLNPSGTGLVYSTFLGGKGQDLGNGLAVDSDGNVYVTGNTYVYGYAWGFPTTAGAFNTVGGYSVAFVSKLDPIGSSLVYSTALGGGNWDVGNAIAVDAGGNAYVTGYTTSSNFPTTAGAFRTTKCGTTTTNDAFVTKLDATGASLIYSTYLCGGTNDVGNGIAVDSSGEAYVVGSTDSSDFPSTLGSYQSVKNAGKDVFVTKVAATGTSLVYSTFIGGASDDQGKAIAVSSGGDAYVTGDTASGDYPTTAGSYQHLFGGGSVDVFMTHLDPSGSSLDYSTYLGGSDTDTGTGIALDADNDIYLTGITFSGDYPTTASSFQPVGGGASSGGFYRDAFVAKFGIVSMTATPTSTETATATWTSTETGTPTPTATHSNTWTAISTATPTDTASRTATLSWTETRTGTETDTETSTLTSTPSTTWTATSSASTTPTPTDTATATWTPLPMVIDEFFVSRNVFDPQTQSLMIKVGMTRYQGILRLDIFNSAGESIRNLEDAHVTAPFQRTYTWDGTNRYGEGCANGVYILHLTRSDDARDARVLLVRR